MGWQEFSGKGKKEDKPKKAAQPEKKAEKKVEEPPMEEPKPVKKQDPLDALPAGTFNMEEWKRFYSNNDEDDSIKWFWEHFDAENYSIWRSDYKYPDELTMVFMSCNLMEVCSSGWRSSRRTPSPPAPSSARATTPPSQVSGFGEGRSSPSICARTGRSTTKDTLGRSWIPPRLRPRPWSPSIGSGRAPTRTAENSTRVRF